MTTDPRDTEVLHRLLDEAFAPYPATAEALDLKQEVRANLTARAAELRAEGATAEDAARRALAELGDVGTLLGDTAPASASPADWLTEQRRNRVRPRPAYAVRTALLGGALGVVVITVVLSVTGVIAPDVAWQAAGAAVAVLLTGWIVGDALRQETTVHFPMSRARAIGFGAASALLLAGLAAATQLASGPNTAWLLVSGSGVVAAAALFTFLGVTATNRTKPWVLRMTEGGRQPGDRFATDPEAAARFGIYTVVIWVAALATFVVLTLTVGWAWSWIALVAGWLVWFLVLSRMLFASPASTRE